MAEFCNQCAQAIFNEPVGDFAGLGDPGPDSGWLVLCEGCGPTLVDANGDRSTVTLPQHRNTADGTVEAP